MSLCRVELVKALPYIDIERLYCCAACEAWSTHIRRRRPRRRRRHNFSFQSITFEGMHQFHSNFTEGYGISKYRTSLKVKAIRKMLSELWPDFGYIWDSINNP